MQRILASGSVVGLVLAFGLVSACQKKKKRSKKDSKTASAGPDVRTPVEKALPRLRKVARRCAAQKSLTSGTRGCKAYKAWYGDHKHLFDNYQRQPKKVHHLMTAGIRLVGTDSLAKQSVGTAVIGQGLYTMAWANKAGRGAPYRRALLEGLKQSPHAKLRKFVVETLASDGGSTRFHGELAVAKALVKVAASDADPSVRRTALDAIKYKLLKKSPPSRTQLRRWFDREKPASKNQRVIIEIAARLKRFVLVVDLCARFQKRGGKSPGACVEARRAAKP